MKKLTYFLVFVIGLGFANAQDVEISDDDLKAYAIANAAVKSITGIEAQEWEIKFLNTVNGEIDERKEAAKEVINLMAKYAMGTSKYKAIRSGLSNDADLKARYAAIEAKFE